MEEDEIFNSTFSKLIQSSKPIETKKVVAMIKKEAKLCHLLNSFTHRQMADKVRSLRKAYIQANSKKKLGKRPRNWYALFTGIHINKDVTLFATDLYILYAYINSS